MALLRKLFWGVFCLLGGYVLMNSIDQPLLPGMAVLLQGGQPENLPRQNAYFALLGLDAPSNVDALDWGRRVAGNLPHAPAVEHGKPVCDLERQHCLKLARQEPAVLQLALREQSLLQARYVAARQLPYFVEGFDDEVMLDFSAALRAQMLRHAQIGLWLEAGQIAPILYELQQDMLFQRRGLAAAHSLISKMVSLAALQRDYVLLADLLRAHPERLSPYLPQVQAMLQPLAAMERDMRPMLRQEMQWLTKVVRFSARQTWFGGADQEGWLGRLPSALVAHLFLPNATLNRLYQLERVDEQLASVGAREFLARSEEAKSVQARLLQAGWRDYYNPAGWEMVRMIRVDHLGYLRRPWELDMFVRLLQLQVLAARQGVTEGQMASWLGQQPLLDIFSGEPVLWDVSRHELYVALQRPAIPYTRFGYGRERIALPLP